MKDQVSTIVKYMCEITENFNVGVAVNLRGQLKPSFFSMVMDEITKEIKGKVPC